MASVTFSTGFHVIKPGLRVSGDEISVVFKGMYDSGIYAGKKYIHIDLTNEPDLTFVEAGVAGPLDTVADVDALYTQLLDAGMTEAFDGFLVDPSDLSIIEIEQPANQLSTFLVTPLTSSDATPTPKQPSGSRLQTRLGLSPSLTSLEQ